MPQEYTFKNVPKNFSNQKDADPQLIGEALEKIAEKYGSIEPIYVVDAARSEDKLCRDALHKHLEWDESVGAEKYRIIQARSILNSIAIVSWEEDRPEPAHISIKVPHKKRAYYPVEVVKSSLTLQELALGQAKKDMEAFMWRYRQFEELCELATTLRDRIEEMRRDLELRPSA